MISIPSTNVNVPHATKSPGRKSTQVPRFAPQERTLNMISVENTKPRLRHLARGRPLPRVLPRYLPSSADVSRFCPRIPLRSLIHVIVTDWPGPRRYIFNPQDRHLTRSICQLSSTYCNNGRTLSLSSMPFNVVLIRTGQTQKRSNSISCIVNPVVRPAMLSY